MTVRKMQKEKDVLFRTKQENQKVQAKTMSEMNALKSVDNDIDEFEKRVLKKSGDSDSDEEMPAIIKKPSQKNKSALGASEMSIDKRVSKLTSTVMPNESIDARVKKSPQVMESIKHQR